MRKEEATISRVASAGVLRRMAAARRGCGVCGTTQRPVTVQQRAYGTSHRVTCARCASRAGTAQAARRRRLEAAEAALARSSRGR